MKLSLQDNFSSSQDLQAIILEVRKYAHLSTQNAIKTRVSGSHDGKPPEISPAAVALIKEWADEKPLTQKSLDELLTTLESLAADSPSITITLAAPPANGLKKILVEWCRENITPNILVNFRFNSTILGGMVIQYRSHVYDWSFRRQILDARNHFPEVLRRV